MKLWVIDYGKGVTLKAIDNKLQTLDLKYLDLLILHHQVGDYIDAYFREMD